MRWAFVSVGAGGLMLVGYLMGLNGVGKTPAARAQEQVGPTEETITKVQESLDSLKTAMGQLSAESLHESATTGINAFAVSVGGVNAVEDLESGRGVDPETYAGLYAGYATEEVAEHLSNDEQGRLTYKNKVVRMYPISRLKQAFEKRLTLSGQSKSAPLETESTDESESTE
ncbi:MAG: hypothetical protein ACKVT0_14895 [Planctomycetaceae bacterium]